MPPHMGHGYIFTAISLVAPVVFLAIGIRLIRKSRPGKVRGLHSPFDPFISWLLVIFSTGWTALTLYVYFAGWPFPEMTPR